MRIRRHHPKDFDGIAGLRWNLKTEHMPPEARPDHRPFSQSYLVQLRDQHDLGQTAHWVLETSKGIEGVITVRLVAKETSLEGQNRHWGYLTNAYVSKGLRGKGYGTALLNHVIAHARERQLEFLLVWPSERSTTLYRRAGFVGSEDPLTLELAGG